MVTDQPPSRQAGSIVMHDETESSPVAHPGPSAVGPVDVVEEALAAAITRASIRGQDDVVKALVDELTARRQARAGVIKLDVERERRSK